MARTRIIDRDLGFRALRRRLGVLNRKSLTIGIHSDDGGEPHEGSAVSVADVGAIHEFGAETSTGIVIPQRSWLRAGISENEAEIRRINKTVARFVVNNRRRMSPDQALDIVGEKIVSLIKKRIRGGIPPGLKASTLAKKGPDKTTPLIDSSQMINSIGHKVANVPAQPGGGGSSS